MYHVYFHIPENLAQPVTEFSASILDTEHSLENLKNEVLFYGLQCIQKMEAVPSDIALCRRVMEYIGNHYTDASLSVSQVAANFQLHPSYLGSVFKKVQHTSVLQYISDIRISAAQKLLKEGTMKFPKLQRHPDIRMCTTSVRNSKKPAGVLQKNMRQNTVKNRDVKRHP